MVCAKKIWATEKQPAHFVARLSLWHQRLVVPFESVHLIFLNDSSRFCLNNVMDEQSIGGPSVF